MPFSAPAALLEVDLQPGKPPVPRAESGDVYEAKTAREP